MALGVTLKNCAVMHNHGAIHNLIRTVWLDV